MNDTNSIILNSKVFHIPSLFENFVKVKKEIFYSLTRTGRYQIISNISEDIVQPFIDFWTNNEIPEITLSNYYDYCQLSDEFQIQFISDYLNTKNDIWNEYDKIFLKLQDPSIQDKFLIEREISKNIDIYLLNLKFLTKKDAFGLNKML
ncbi:hypothetical protein M9Y10_006260 [Tritrichomonas musculus]|uniref:Uncharacterized protein n=1 Tax=Tritrichomonas musculus TaxID=1915356 RepID=A0ABR2JE76_9EUKA